MVQAQAARSCHPVADSDGAVRNKLNQASYEQMTKLAAIPFRELIFTASWRQEVSGSRRRVYLNAFQYKVVGRHNASGRGRYAGPDNS
jgi:hypothetical protein